MWPATLSLCHLPVAQLSLSLSCACFSWDPLQGPVSAPHCLSTLGDSLLQPGCCCVWQVQASGNTQKLKRTRGRKEAEPVYPQGSRALPGIRDHAVLLRQTTRGSQVSSLIFPDEDVARMKVFLSKCAVTRQMLDLPSPAQRTECSRNSLCLEDDFASNLEYIHPKMLEINLDHAQGFWHLYAYDILLHCLSQKSDNATPDS